MLDEIEDDTQRRLVLRLGSAVVHADHQIDDGDLLVLLSAIERWGPNPGDQGLLEPMLDGADFQVRPRGVAGDAAPWLHLR